MVQRYRECRRKIRLSGLQKRLEDRKESQGDSGEDGGGLGRRQVQRRRRGQTTGRGEAVEREHVVCSQARAAPETEKRQREEGEKRPNTCDSPQEASRGVSSLGFLLVLTREHQSVLGSLEVSRGAAGRGGLAEFILWGGVPQLSLALICGGLPRENSFRVQVPCYSLISCVAIAFVFVIIDFSAGLLLQESHEFALAHAQRSPFRILHELQRAISVRVDNLADYDAVSVRGSEVDGRGSHAEVQREHEHLRSIIADQDLVHLGSGKLLPELKSAT